VACSLLPQALVGFAAACPGVSLLFQEEPAALLLDRVRHGELELGWGLYPTAHDELVFEPLGRDQMVAVMHAGHALAQRAHVGWDDLRQHKLVSASRQSGVRIYAERAAEAAGVLLQPSYQTGSLTTGMALVRCGLGCAVMPALSLGSLNLDHVVVRPMQPGVWREIGLIQRQGWPLSPAAGVFAHLARQATWPANLPADPAPSPR
jgi:DNA-binding transcriptional LysR family regulator